MLLSWRLRGGWVAAGMGRVSGILAVGCSESGETVEVEVEAEAVDGIVAVIETAVVRKG